MATHILWGCGSGLGDDARFCPKCGRAVERQVCHACGAPLIEGARFCRICGKEVAPVTAPPPADESEVVRRHRKKVKAITRWVTGAALAAVAISLIILLFQFFGRATGPFGLYPSDGGPESSLFPPASVPSQEQYPPPVVLQYVDRDGRQRSAYSHPGRLTIIAEKDAAPEAIRALLKSMGGTVDVEIANCNLYFVRGLDGKESASVSSLLNNPMIASAFPTPVWSAKELETYILDDYRTIINWQGKYLHYNAADKSLYWSEDISGQLRHGPVVQLVSGVSGKNSIDCSYVYKDKAGNLIYGMAVDRGLKMADERAREDHRQGKITVLNNSWGADLAEGPLGPSAFRYDERNVYEMLVQFLKANSNAIAVKAAGNEGLDISEVLKWARLGAEDRWKRLVIVGALNSNLNPTNYSNYAGREDILWVPELTTKDGSPVPGTSFTAPKITRLIERIGRERPDLTPEQLVSVLFDERVSPRINGRPTIADPLSTDTFVKAIEVATKRFGEMTFVRPLAPARDLTGTWKNTFSGQGLIIQNSYPSSSNLYPSGSDPEDASWTFYYDVVWEIKQSGNTVAGYMTLKWVKEGGYWKGRDLLTTNRAKSLSGTYYVTGTVEGSKITIRFSDSKLAVTLTGSFTDIDIKCSAHHPGKYSQGVPPVTDADSRITLSLSRVR